MKSYSKEDQLSRSKKKVCKSPGCKVKVLHSEYCVLHMVKKKNKYNAVRQTYNGYNYDSTLEANHAAKLDWEIKAGIVKRWERQHKIECYVNGVKICNYYIDFKVWLSDGSIEYHEVKGAETQLWRFKWKLSKALNPDWQFKIFK